MPANNKVVAFDLYRTLLLTSGTRLWRRHQLEYTWRLNGMDVQPVLTQLSEIPTITAVVFSNGTQSMVSNSLQNSPDLSPHASVFTDIVSAGGSSVQRGDIYPVGGYPFDIVGARSVGLSAIWVDRGGRGWMDAAPPELRPTVVVRSLEEIVEVVQGA
ncbi:hypothetical protein BDW75DRAFT_229355 [Aspergillus navahoensis]